MSFCDIRQVFPDRITFDLYFTKVGVIWILVDAVEAVQHFLLRTKDKHLGGLKSGT